MLYIYDYLVDIIQKHLDERKIDADVRPHIGRAWHCYRFMQVAPKGITGYVHYEYINGHWELHFENSAEDAEVEILRRKEERAGFMEREKRSVEEMADMKGKVKWMANRLNGQKRTIALLAVGLALAVGC